MGTKLFTIVCISYLAGCQLQAALLGGKPPRAASSPSRPSAPAPRSTLASKVAPPTANLPLRGAFEPGALTYRGGRLYYVAWAGVPTTGDRAPEVALPTVTLSAGTRVLGTTTLRRRDKLQYLPEAVGCEGVYKQSSADRIEFFDGCSFAVELGAGDYTLRLDHAGKTLDQVTFAMTPSHDIDGNTQLIVAPSARNARAFLDTGNVKYWHRVDARDEVESLLCAIGAAAARWS